MLNVNLFADGGALLETQPQDDASIAVNVPPAEAETLTALVASAEVASALAALFLAGCTAGERSVDRRVGGKAKNG